MPSGEDRNLRKAVFELPRKQPGCAVYNTVWLQAVHAILEETPTKRKLQWSPTHNIRKTSENMPRRSSRSVCTCGQVSASLSPIQLRVAFRPRDARLPMRSRKQLMQPAHVSWM